MKYVHLLIGLVNVIPFVLTANVTAWQPRRSTEPYYDIGDFRYKVTTNSLGAQKWFDRGLAMCIAFNHEEAVRCFERAIAADPGMAMG